jgi:endonuclease/exonuclease/phosphatase family metal-dependent hydrolase
MTYNIWVGGTSLGQPLSRTVGVIQTAQADVVGIQEQGSSGPALATALGFHYRNLGGSTAILSRYPIVEGANQGAKLQLSPTQQAYIFNVHLTPYPYQPYDIRDSLITSEAQAIAAAQATRGSSVGALLSGMAPALASPAPVFLTGDFNEPSHLDWTAEAGAAGLHFGRKVAWPASSAVTTAGMVDAFRELRPDEVNDRGETWTPGYPAPNVDADEVHDRIDFVYYTGLNVKPTAALTLGYNANDLNTDIGIQPYPSDHRAVVVEFSMPSCAVTGDLNGDCRVTTVDWMQFRASQQADLIGLSRGQAYSRGDLNGDFRNDHADFMIFKAAFEAANGAGSFNGNWLRVPEPSSAILAAMVFIVCPFLARNRNLLRKEGVHFGCINNFLPDCRVGCGGMGNSSVARTVAFEDSPKRASISVNIDCIAINSGSSAIIANCWSAVTY